MASLTAVQTIRELIDLRATQSAEQSFLVDPANWNTLTFAEVRHRAASIAAYIENQGIQRGESVAYAMNNGVDCALCLLGTLYGGFRTTAINLVSGQRTIGYVLAHSRSKLVFTQEQQKKLLVDAIDYQNSKKESIAEPESVVIDSEFWNSLPEPAQSRTGQVEANDDGLLMYTSGTTGQPKGVVLSQYSLVAAGRNPTQAHQLVPEDRALCVLPLYHINGFCTTIMAPLFSGSSVVLPERFSTRRFWGWMRDNHCTWFSVVPTHISYLLHQAHETPHDPCGLQQVRFARSASAPLSPDIQRGFEQQLGIPVIETMGLTETGGQILSNPMPPGIRKIGSPGVAVGDEVMIADEQQRELPADEEGEILIRGDNVMNRYLDNIKASEEALTSDGWLRSGDLGHMDEDGYVFVTGRIKELIIKGGENVAPREIDEALYHHPDIVEAAAFACRCQNYGQRIEAAVALAEESTATEGELIKLCRRILGDFKCPDRVHILDELPKGPSGKIQRLKLAEHFDNR